jgi:hypothetical protein
VNAAGARGAVTGAVVPGLVVTGVVVSGVVVAGVVVAGLVDVAPVVDVGAAVDPGAAVDATADEVTDDAADFESLEHAGASRARSTGAAMTKRDGRMTRSLAPALVVRSHQKTGAAQHLMAASVLCRSAVEAEWST